MTTPAPPPATGSDGDGEDLFDGYTLDQLSDYLDTGMEPRNPRIDRSAACQIALASLRSVRTATTAMLETEAAKEPATDPAWLTIIMNSIGSTPDPGEPSHSITRIPTSDSPPPKAPSAV